MSKWDSKHKRDRSDDKIHLEKGDLKAMVIAAFTVYFPALLLMLVIMFGIIWFFFFR